ncbi:hypothetical protein A2U01_0072079, partial [Trifolium medium]|nr:hypothetical protein [Trifolium medium]
ELEQQVVGTFEGEVVGPSIRHGVSLRLVEQDEAYSERLEIVNCAKSMNLRLMRTTRDSHK